MRPCPGTLKACADAVTKLTTQHASGSIIHISYAGLAAVFNRLTSSRDPAVTLYEAPRAAVLTPLLIRRARVEDHDDMLLLLESAGKRFPALAKLPMSSRPEAAFALTRVVSGQVGREVPKHTAPTCKFKLSWAVYSSSSSSSRSSSTHWG